MMMAGSFQGTRAIGTVFVVEIACIMPTAAWIVDHAVLDVDGQRVPALMRHHLGGVGVRNGEPAGERAPAGGDRLLELILAHRRFLPWG